MRISAYKSHLTALANQYKCELQQQEQFALQMVQRWNGGLQFVNAFAQWLRELYHGIDVKAENTVMACRSELPVNAAKFHQLQNAAKRDVERRRQLTNSALVATYEQYQHWASEVMRLQRVQRA